MAKEAERKFLVSRGAWRERVEQSTPMVQFYLASAADRSVRVRIRSDTAVLTLKFGASARVRDEFEYPIPLADGRDMMALAVGRPVEKTRHIVRHRGRAFEVDEFSGALAGLVVAELETADEVADAELPDWLGREVTDDPAYLNSSLALRGRPGEAP
ncbi:MAG: CYTH domain-containing protein [Rhizobiaceae bacterium]